MAAWPKWAKWEHWEQWGVWAGSEEAGLVGSVQGVPAAALAAVLDVLVVGAGFSFSPVKMQKIVLKPVKIPVKLSYRQGQGPYQPQ